MYEIFSKIKLCHKCASLVNSVIFCSYILLSCLVEPDQYEHTPAMKIWSFFDLLEGDGVVKAVMN